MGNITDFMLTTIDNKYSPFDEFDLWVLQDMRLGYNTPGLIDRLIANADEFNDIATQQVMRDIIELNPFGVHIMVRREDYPLEIKSPL